MSFIVSYFAGAGDQFFDDNGVPLDGGLIYTYAAGTTTPATTYTSNTGAVANTNPIVLNAAGRTPYDIWVNSGTYYKFVLKTSVGVTIGTYDNMPGVGDPDLINNMITVTGTNVLIGTATVPYTAYVTGMQLTFEAVATNTGAMTLNLDGLGVKDLTSDGTLAIPAGAVTAGSIVELVYDGLVFQVMGVLADGVVTTGKIADNAVTYAKMQNVTATSRVLGRKTAGAGDPEECTLSEVLDFIGSAAQGDILYRGASAWSRLGAGTSGQFLKTLGAAADPVWDVTSVAGVGTAQTFSGTTIDFTGIPSGVRRVDIAVSGLTLNGTPIDNLLYVQIGDSGGLETSGYLANDGVVSSTSAYIFNAPGYTGGYFGNITLLNLEGNLWVCSGMIMQNGGTFGTGVAVGNKTLTATLDRLRIGVNGGGGTLFTGGRVNILYS